MVKTAKNKPGSIWRSAVAALCVALSLSACSQEKKMTPATSAQKQQLVLQNTPASAASVVLGMGCFWGAEKRMSELPGVLDVESCYANGDIAGTYEAVLAHERALQYGRAQGRNHAEVVKVTFDPERVTLAQVLARFWESHDPTQGDRQGNDVGSNYRSAIYTQSDAQLQTALATKAVYQEALSRAGKGAITTDIAPLTAYFPAEASHQDYLKKNPQGYCGLGGTGVAYPQASGGQAPVVQSVKPLIGSTLNQKRQLVVFEAAECAYCRQFQKEVLDHWASDVPVVTTMSSSPPTGWRLEKALFATPTIVLFEKGVEVSRYTGYNGDQKRFWHWLGFQLLTPEQRHIAFEQGTEYPGTGSHLDEKRPGTFVDPITGAPLFRSDTKFNSGTGWPSFFNPVPGSITLHEDTDRKSTRLNS